jgi:hypothetical protein
MIHQKSQDSTLINKGKGCLLTAQKVLEFIPEISMKFPLF